MEHTGTNNVKGECAAGF